MIMSQDVIVILQYWAWHIIMFCVLRWQIPKRAKTPPRTRSHQGTPPRREVRTAASFTRRCLAASRGKGVKGYGRAEARLCGAARRPRRHGLLTTSCLRLAASASQSTSGEKPERSVSPARKSGRMVVTPAFTPGAHLPPPAARRPPSYSSAASPWGSRP